MATFRKCLWTPEEDMRLVTYISRYGTWNWTQMPALAGLSRSGKSCRLRWYLNYLDPRVKRGNYTREEDEIIINLRSIGAGWSAIALRLPGRTDNEIKNRWHSKLIKKQIANDMAVETMAPIIERIEAEIDADLFPEAPDLEEDYPISSDILNMNVYLNDKPVPPTFADAHTSFWREPFSFENIYDIDEYAAYVDPQIGMTYPQNWFGGPFNSYYGVL
ncbi:hypothetical protein DCAR_0209138 [Daucus carota subsp. sativus]|uniref:Uncharacterized protein n=1 Tax=Daucus carota subsp. sativus TaxID=79200 RepID=A0A166F2B9_DAUCS|nr:PREDICTED: transcription repressor MYB4-like [Daucus carota subsp. sativus]WOG89898.1 hypothetical protein DCAR_0209138 [Daucus carota subsp. sativus]